MTTTPFYEQFGAYQAEVAATIQSLLKDSIIPRIWSQDHTVWDPSPQEISNRLGWLSSAAATQLSLSLADFPALAEPPALYWQKRSQLAWN